MPDELNRPAFLDAANRYQLLYPIEYLIGEEKHVLEHLQLRRLTLKDRLVMDQAIVHAEKLEIILSDMTGLMGAVIRKMDAVDADRIEEIFLFFRSSPLESAESGKPSFLDANNGYRLLYPIEYKVGEEVHAVDHLQLRRLTLADRMILDENVGYASRLARILANMTDRPYEAILKMDVIDSNRIDRIFGHFLQPGTATGAIS